MDLGCGVGRRAISLAALGYPVTAVDLDDEMLAQCSRNWHQLNGAGQVRVKRGDMHRLEMIAGHDECALITHSGLLEHLPDRAAIVAHLRRQLTVARHVVFDVPIDTLKNRQLFGQDAMFRHLWDASAWTEVVASAGRVIASRVECHEHPTMTDHFVCLLSRETEVSDVADWVAAV